MSAAERNAATEPLTAAEFASLVARLGLLAPDVPVAVGVSGGPDSMALASLLAGWARRPPVAIVVDHGLRASSAIEARLTADRLALIGCEPVIVRLDGLLPGSALQERARVRRHAVLAATCRERVLFDLFLAHHRDDQAETRHFRRERGSAPDGLAGMTLLAERDDLRLLRPLLDVRRSRLRRTAECRGIAFFDDPSNGDGRFARGRLRLRFPDGVPEREGDGEGRAERDAAAAAFLARHAEFHEAGIVVLDRGHVPPRVLGALLRVVGGRHHAPRLAALERLAGALRPATLGGVRIARAPRRLGGLFTLSREPAALGTAVLALPGVTWDGRFRVRRNASLLPGLSLRAAGSDAAHLVGRSAWPSAIARTLPVLAASDGAIADPLFFRDGTASRERLPVVFSPEAPAVSSFFTIGRQAHGVSSSAWAASS